MEKNTGTDNDETSGVVATRKTIKKKGVEKMAKAVSVDSSDILNKIFGEKKSDFDFGTLHIRSDLAEALKIFEKEDLAVVIEESLKIINVEKISKEYEKKKEK